MNTSKARPWMVVGGLAVAGLLAFLLLGRDSTPKTEPESGAASAGFSLEELKRKRKASPNNSDPISASGTVRRTDSKEPVAGATVLLLEYSAQQLEGASGEPLTATTDSKGRWKRDGLRPGSYVISASARGLKGEALPRLSLDSGKDNEGIDLELAPGGLRLFGTVSDIGGGSIPGAIVTAKSMDSGFMSGGGAVLADFADQQGNFELFVDRGAYSLSASSPDYVAGNEFLMVTSEREVNFALAPAGMITGRVIDMTSGEPVPDALVRASGGQGDAGSKFHISGLAGVTAMSDAEGSFVLKGLGSGAIALRASAKGLASSDDTTVELGIAETVTDVDVFVDKAFTISGFIVTTRDESEGVANAMINALDARNQSMVNAHKATSDDGYFEIRGVQPGNYQINVVGEGIVWSMMATSVKVEDADKEDVVIKVDLGVTVKGRVEPPGPATIAMELAGEVGIMNMLQVVSISAVGANADAEGNFELSAVPPGEFKIVATTKKGHRGELLVTVAAEDQEGLVVPMETLGSISGVVVGESGAPVVGAKLTLEPVDEDRDFAGTMNSAMSGLMGHSNSDANGAFTIVGVAPGTYKLGVGDSRGPRDWAGEAPAAIELEGQSAVSGLRLVVEESDGVIEGRVTDDSGQPVVDAWVRASKEDTGNAYSLDEGEPPVLTDTDGRFEVRNLRKGKYTLVSNSAKAGARAKREGIAPGESITLQLQSLASASGLVSFQGQPVKGYTLKLDGPVNRIRRINKGDGRYHLQRLEAGLYDISAVSAQGTVNGKLVIEEGTKETTQDLAIEPWCSVRGRVVDGDSEEAAAELMIMVSSEEGPSNDLERGMDLLTGKGPRTGPDGAFRVDKLPCGAIEVSFIEERGGLFGGGKPGRIASSEAQLAPGEVKDLGVVKTKTPDDDEVDDDETGPYETGP